MRRKKRHDRHRHRGRHCFYLGLGPCHPPSPSPPAPSPSASSAFLPCAVGLVSIYQIWEDQTQGLFLLPCLHHLNRMQKRKQTRHDRRSGGRETGDPCCPAASGPFPPTQDGLHRRHRQGKERQGWRTNDHYHHHPHLRSHWEAAGDGAGPVSSAALVQIPPDPDELALHLDVPVLAAPAGGAADPFPRRQQRVSSEFLLYFEAPSIPP